jgi:hypothetical protein
MGWFPKNRETADFVGLHRYYQNGFVLQKWLCLVKPRFSQKNTAAVEHAVQRLPLSALIN